jgi:hypothetical protein
MTCAECLLALETESLRDMTADSAVMQHCARCPECARVTTTLRDREYETATVLNGLLPISSPLTVAETAVRTDQRRRVGRVAVMISGAALVVTLFIVAVTIVYPAFEDGDTRVAGLHTTTISLSCLSPQQAGEIIEPYVQSRGGRYFAPASGISAITVRGTLGELSKARELIREFENHPSAACRAPMTIIEDLRRHMSELGPNPVPQANPMPGKPPTSLLGPSGKSMFDKGPSGSGPVTTPDKATAPPKKQ